MPVVGIVADTFDGIGIGETSMLQVRVWDRAKFRSFEEAVVGGEYGASQPFNYTVPPMGSTPDKYYMDNLRAFAVIPEPSTTMLGILGAVTLLGVRRRKQS
ncbi:MAG TPA: PEP-CTERM sorting domain-containing protein [Candidatus Dormibacteraeota bacterium]|nr:PEP-CTERM sorting domain-containing protein [Candidatus Dormibacteraeota bacterium]